MRIINLSKVKIGNAVVIDFDKSVPLVMILIPTVLTLSKRCSLARSRKSWNCCDVRVVRPEWVESL